MKVSVLIVNHNYERYVGQAIDSALGQSHPDVQVVLVDGNSTDGSGSIIRSYGNRICAVFKENEGPSSSVNTGFAHCRGDIVLLLDSDDYLHPEAAAKIAAHWTPETGVLHHRLCKVDEAGREIGFDPPKSLPLDSGNVVPLMLKQRGRYHLPATSGRVFSRKILEAVLPIPVEKFRMVADLYLGIATPFLSPVTVLDDTLAYYRVHGSNYFASNRRTVTRAKMLQQHRWLDLAWELTRDEAIKRNIALPNPEPLGTSHDLFGRLLLALSGPERISLRTRLKHIWSIVCRATSDSTGSLALRIRQMVLALGVGLSPRWLLARAYPGLFQDPSKTEQKGR